MEDTEAMEGTETMVEGTETMVEDTGIMEDTVIMVGDMDTMEDTETTAEDMETVVETNKEEDMETMGVGTTGDMETLGMVGVMVLVTAVEAMDRDMVVGTVTKDMVAEMATLAMVVATMVDMGVALAEDMVVAPAEEMVGVGVEVTVEDLVAAEMVDGTRKQQDMYMYRIKHLGCA